MRSISRKVSYVPLLNPHKIHKQENSIYAIFLHSSWRRINTDMLIYNKLIIFISLRSSFSLLEKKQTARTYARTEREHDFF